MKVFKTISVIALLATSTIFVSCDKNNNTQQGDLTNDVVGTYKGTITYSGNNTSNNATSDVTPVNDYTVQVHCYGGDLDTTYNVTLYPNGEQMMTGLTAEDFEEMYGYMPDDMQDQMQENMNGSGMNGDGMMNGDSSDWMNYEEHMGEGHDDNDDHDGEFNMSEGTFEYEFNMIGDSRINFSGNK